LKRNVRLDEAIFANPVCGIKLPAKVFKNSITFEVTLLPLIKIAENC